jgi:membrane protein
MAGEWKPGKLTSTQFARRVWHEIEEDDILGRAAELAYYFFFALFPMLIFTVSLLGVVAGANSGLQQQMMTWIGRALPPDASSIVSKTLQEVMQASGAGKMSLGVILALWSASAGMSAVMHALNICYDVKETRPFWKARAVSLALTLGVSVLVIAALAILLYGNTIANWVGGAVHLSMAATWAWKILQWPAALVFMLLAFALMYYFAPSVADQKWLWLTPGSVAGVTLWVLSSVALRVYLHFFNSYSKTYGSLAAVIILLLWFYVTGLAILLGGEINAEMEHAAAEAGRPDAKAEGEKTAGGAAAGMRRGGRLIPYPKAQVRRKA